MVPHTGILRAIALAACLEPNAARRRTDLAAAFGVRFPASFQFFWDSEIEAKLPVEARVRLATCQPFIDGWEALFNAARILKLEQYILIRADGPTVSLPESVIKWRKHEQQRIALESLMLCGITITQIATDMRLMYNTTFDEGDLEIFQILFMSQEFTEGIYWENYGDCIAGPEYVMKTRLKLEPKDFVRWKLGIPVSLDAEMVLNRLMSEAYFTERLIKHGRRDPSDPNALPILDRDDVTRMKLERETVFKCLDRMVKLKELGLGANTDTEAMAMLKKVMIDVAPADFPSMADLTDG